MYNYTVCDDVSKQVVEYYKDAKESEALQSLMEELKESEQFIMPIHNSEANTGEEKYKSNLNTDDISDISTNNFNLNSLPIDIDKSNIQCKMQSNTQNYEIIPNQIGLDIDILTSNNSVLESKNTSLTGSEYEGSETTSVIKITNKNAFSKNELANFEKIGNEYKNNIKSIKFKLNALDIQRIRALTDSDIALTVSITDSIYKNTKILNKKQQELIKYNTDVKNREVDFDKRYNEFVDDIRNQKVKRDADIITLVDVYGQNVVNHYKKNQFLSVLEKYSKVINQNDIIKFLKDNEAISDVIRDNIDEIIERYLKG